MFYVSLNLINPFKGGGESPDSPIDSILFYNTVRDTWQPAVNLAVPRFLHTVAVFPDVSQLCP